MSQKWLDIQHQERKQRSAGQRAAQLAQVEQRARKARERAS